MLALLGKHNHFVLYKIPIRQYPIVGDRLIDQLAKLIRFLQSDTKTISISNNNVFKPSPIKQTRVYDAYRRLVDNIGNGPFIEFENLSTRIKNRPVQYEKWNAQSEFRVLVKDLGSKYEID